VSLGPAESLRLLVVAPCGPRRRRDDGPTPRPSTLSPAPIPPTDGLEASA
jgi:hypothetical protein